MGGWGPLFRTISQKNRFFLDALPKSHKGEDYFRTSPGPKASPLEVSGVVGATIYKQTSLSLSQKQDIEKLPTQK